MDNGLKITDILTRVDRSVINFTVSMIALTEMVLPLILINCSRVLRYDARVA